TASSWPAWREVRLSKQSKVGSRKQEQWQVANDEWQANVLGHLAYPLPLTTRHCLCFRLFSFRLFSFRLSTAVALCLCVSVAKPVFAQVESVPGSAPRFLWVSNGRVEGHLALSYSPAGAFSPDSSTLAVVSEDKVVLMNLSDASVRKVLRPRIESVTDLQVQSANFISPTRLFL